MKRKSIEDLIVYTGRNPKKKRVEFRPDLGDKSPQDSIARESKKRRPQQKLF